MKKALQHLTPVLALLLFVPGLALSSNLHPLPDILPVKDTVTMIDLGASACIPCKMMAPILEEVATEYKGRAAIAFIDVWKQPEEAKKFKIGLIPTQIFYDRNGKEVFRHAGFMDKKAITAKLAELGVSPVASGKK